MKPKIGVHVDIQKYKNEDMRKGIFKVAKERNADIVVYYGPILPHCDCELERKIEEFAKASVRPNIVLFIMTGGGSPDVAYRIARALQRRVGDKGIFTVVVTTYCKSAGTLIAVGGDELAISDRGELGPLDIQLLKKDELDEYASGLTPLHALATLRSETFKAYQDYFLEIRETSGQQISTASAAQIATRLASECFSTIYQQIDPLRLGENERAMDITYRYGSRLDRGNLQEGALQVLVADYPSHSYVIDREEAAELFRRVRKTSEAESNLARLFRGLYRVVLEDSPFFIEYFAVPADNMPKRNKKDTSNAGRQAKNKRSDARGTSHKTRRDRQTTHETVREQIVPEGDSSEDEDAPVRRNGRRRSSRGVS